MVVKPQIFIFQTLKNKWSFWKWFWKWVSFLPNWLPWCLSILHGMAPNINMLSCNHWYQSHAREGVLGGNEEDHIQNQVLLLSFDLYWDTIAGKFETVIYKSFDRFVVIAFGLCSLKCLCLFDEKKINYWCLFLLYPVAVTPYGYASRFEIHFDDKFEVSFGREGETMSLGCRVVITPEIKHFQPEIQWYRNGEP